MSKYFISERAVVTSEMRHTWQQAKKLMNSCGTVMRTTQCVVLGAVMPMTQCVVLGTVMQMTQRVVRGTVMQMTQCVVLGSV